MLTIRRKKALLAGLPVLVALSAANHLSPLLRGGKGDRGGRPEFRVRAEAGPAGHNTIAVDEQSLSPGAEEAFLRFSALGEWDFDRDAPTECPPGVRALDGKKAKCVGFMYPLQSGARVTAFCLLHSTQTCCYGPRPQYNQYLFVEMPKPVKFERLAPVLVTGTFFVDPQPKDGYIYRMEGAKVEAAGEDEPDVDAVSAARKAGLPLFPFDKLALAREGRAVPSEIAALEGRTVVVDGYIVDRGTGAAPRLLVGGEWWDGVSKGVPPTPYNAIAVFPGAAGRAPPLWKQRAVLTGTLRVSPSPDAWRRSGIASLHEAVEGVPGAGAGGANQGPPVPAWAEGLALVALLALSVGRRPAGLAEPKEAAE